MTNNIHGWGLSKSLAVGIQSILTQFFGKTNIENLTMQIRR